jgi:hypothetical protein
VIAWGNFLVVLLASIVGGCGIVLLFSVGLRLIDVESPRPRRVLGVVCFVACALVVAFGIALVIPSLAPFLSSVFGG